MPWKITMYGVRPASRGPYVLPVLLAVGCGLGVQAQALPAVFEAQDKLRPLTISQMVGSAGPQTVPSTSQQPPTPVLEPLPVVKIDQRQTRTGQIFDLKFSQPVALRDLLRLLVRDTSINLVLPQDLEGTFSGDLTGVTLEEALDLILPQHGLDYSIEGRVLRVFKREFKTRIYNIDYIATLRGGPGRCPRAAVRAAAAPRAARAPEGQQAALRAEAAAAAAVVPLRSAVLTAATCSSSSKRVSRT